MRFKGPPVMACQARLPQTDGFGLPSLDDRLPVFGCPEQYWQGHVTGNTSCAPVLDGMVAGVKTALLVTGGDAPGLELIQHRLEECSFICAADSGLDVLISWGVEPDLVVGDMDSISDPAVLDRYPGSIRHPADKDDTDTEIGIRELRARGYQRILLIGGGGGRLDHLLAIRALFDRPWGQDEWLTHRERVVRIAGGTIFAVPLGSTVSVFPLSTGASGMASTGLKWPLDGLCWEPGEFGVSNRAVSSEICISPGTHPVLVVLPLLA
jgi:thiamine pyrophosphokinase